jgi:hypothetical protein
MGTARAYLRKAATLRRNAVFGAYHRPAPGEVAEWLKALAC